VHVLQIICLQQECQSGGTWVTCGSRNFAKQTVNTTQRLEFVSGNIRLGKFVKSVVRLLGESRYTYVISWRLCRWTERQGSEQWRLCNVKFMWSMYFVVFWSGHYSDKVSVTVSTAHILVSWLSNENRYSQPCAACSAWYCKSLLCTVY
jgi:hypothetical protein